MATATADIPKVLGVTEAELREILIEFGLMKEREKHRLEEDARLAAEREMADEAKRATDIARVPKVVIEWERDPVKGSCSIGGREYAGKGKGPLFNAAMNPPRKVKRGTRLEVPACDGVVLEEGGFATVVENRDACEGMWTPMGAVVGIQDNLPRSDDSKAWERLAG